MMTPKERDEKYGRAIERAAIDSVLRISLFDLVLDSEMNRNHKLIPQLLRKIEAAKFPAMLVLRVTLGELKMDNKGIYTLDGHPIIIFPQVD